ncbi:MAG: flavodoxin family protein [Planctomycetota bacterium]|jgi:flavodoxin
MKNLIIYYSFENNTKLIAENIAEAIGADLLDVKPKHEIKKGFGKYFWGGKQVLMKEKPELLPLDKNWQDYDVIFIGTPVWAWTFAPPLSTFFAANKISDKKVALFCCHGGGKGNIFSKMKAELEGNEILGEIDFLDPLKRDTEENVKKAKEWAEGIVEGM